MTESSLHYNIHRYTAPCTDNGREFTRRDRIDLLEADLQGSSYCLYRSSPLAHVYRHMDYVEGSSTILISTHIDSLYSEYQARSDDDVLIGTYDNSATNAIAVSLMRSNRLPAQVLVAFTGNEEKGMEGASQVVRLLRAEHDECETLEFVLTLDLTYEGYPDKSYTVENAFCRKTPPAASALKFRDEEAVKTYLRSILNDDEAARIENDYADESCRYEEYNLNGATLCLPCDPIDGEDMHSEEGVRITKQSVDTYAEVLSVLTNRIASDLASMSIYPFSSPGEKLGGR